MIALALENWVICIEFKRTNFIAHGSFRCISSQLRRPKYKNFPGEHVPGRLKTVWSRSCLRPLSWLLPCVGALQAFQVQFFARIFSSISHQRHRYRLEHYSGTVKSGSKMLLKKPFLFIFYIKHFARYEFCIGFVSSKLSWELFSVFCTLAYFPADVSDICPWKKYISMV